MFDRDVRFEIPSSRVRDRDPDVRHSAPKKKRREVFEYGIICIILGVNQPIERSRFPSFWKRQLPNSSIVSSRNCSKSFFACTCVIRSVDHPVIKSSPCSNAYPHRCWLSAISSGIPHSRMSERFASRHDSKFGKFLADRRKLTFVTSPKLFGYGHFIEGKMMSRFSIKMIL